MPRAAKSRPVSERYASTLTVQPGQGDFVDTGTARGSGLEQWKQPISRADTGQLDYMSTVVPIDTMDIFAVRRYAARRRQARGFGKPETFDFLGFTHICGKARDGRFGLRRVTISKRMRAKLREVKQQLRRHRHQPVQGR